MKYLITLVFVFLLSACDSKIGVSNPSSSIDGTYTSIDGKNSYVFTSNKEVQTVTFGTLKKASYTLKEGAINWQFVGGMPQMFVMNSDGSLTSGTGTKYTKQ